MYTKLFIAFPLFVMYDIITDVLVLPLFISVYCKMLHIY